MISKNIILLLIIITAFEFSCKSKSGRLVSNPENNKSLTGKVVRILDGDTYDILINGEEIIRVRMEGIDAPERGMPFYYVSKDYLGQLCFNKQVILKIIGKDSFSRNLGLTYLADGRELGHEMIRAGLAWHYKKFNSDIVLSNLESEAKIKKRGLWIDENPMEPWINRSLHKQGISTIDSFNLKVNQ